MFTAIIENMVLSEIMDWLSISNVMAPASSPLSLARRRTNHTLWQVAVMSVMYSASQDENTTSFFYDCQVMNHVSHVAKEEEDAIGSFVSVCLDGALT